VLRRSRPTDRSLKGEILIGSRPKVLITAKSLASSSAALRVLENAGCEVRLEVGSTLRDESWLVDQCREIDALVVTMEPLTSRIIDAAANLKVIARPGVGYDTVDLPAATRRKIAVTIAAGQNDQSVADFAMGLLLLAARGIMSAAAACQERQWQRVTGTEVWNKTLTIVGLGRIGQGMARRARGFDMRVLAVSRHPDPRFVAQHGIEVVSLEEGLRAADFVSLHAPLTPDTRYLINERTLGQMKRGAYLINTARGGLIDEQALANAVRSGYLAGAAVDVLIEQGAGSRSPLIGIPQIIVTPHMATYASEAMERVAVSTARSIVAVLDGERPPYVVNPEIYG
jgi:phosphoglycerate dehydrogenase-like enzyme